MDSEQVIKKLGDFGCDTKGALGRVVGNVELYVELLRVYFTSDVFDKLCLSAKDGDVHGTIMLAHDIKGVSGNLGITSIYNLSNEVVENLRAGKPIEGEAEKIERIISGAKELNAIISE